MRTMFNTMLLKVSEQNEWKAAVMTKNKIVFKKNDDESMRIGVWNAKYSVDCKK